MFELSIRNTLQSIDESMKEIKKLYVDAKNKIKAIQQSKKEEIIDTNGMVFFPDPSLALSMEGEEIQHYARPRYTTKVYQHKEKEVTGEFILVNERGEGAVSEMYLLSDNTPATNKIYTIEILADGLAVYDGTWTEFSERHGYEEDLSCEDDDTYYVLKFKSIFYRNSIYIRILNSQATFKIIRIKTLQRVNLKKS